MVEDRIGYRYAKSIYGLATEKKVIPEVRADMLTLSETFAGSKDLRLLLSSPLVAGSKKQTVLTSVFGSHLKSEMVKHLMEIIVRKGREAFLPNVASAFLGLYDQEHKIMRGTLSSAIALSDKAIAEIKAKMEKQTGHTFELETEIDPNLIGGFTLKVGDQLFDGSVAGSIRKVRREFIN